MIFFIKINDAFIKFHDAEKEYNDVFIKLNNVNNKSIDVKINIVKTWIEINDAIINFIDANIKSFDDLYRFYNTIFGLFNPFIRFDKLIFEKWKNKKDKFLVKYNKYFAELNEYLNKLIKFPNEIDKLEETGELEETGGKIYKKMEEFAKEGEELNKEEEKFQINKIFTLEKKLEALREAKETCEKIGKTKATEKTKDAWKKLADTLEQEITVWNQVNEENLSNLVKRREIPGAWNQVVDALVNTAQALHALYQTCKEPIEQIREDLWKELKESEEIGNAVAAVIQTLMVQKKKAINQKKA